PYISIPLLLRAHIPRWNVALRLLGLLVEPLACDQLHGHLGILLSHPLKAHLRIRVKPSLQLVHLIGAGWVEVAGPNLEVALVVPIPRALFELPASAFVSPPPSRRRVILPPPFAVAKEGEESGPVCFHKGAHVAVEVRVIPSCGVALAATRIA